MATLAFNVEADYEKVIRLRDEIARLEQELNKVAQNGTPEEIGRLESQLESCRTEMKNAVAVASQLGNEIEKGIAQKAQDASQSMGEFGKETESALSGIKEMEFGSAQEKIDALSYAIYNNEVVLADSVKQLQQWREDARQAFETGDTGTLKAITKDINEQIAKIQDLTSETEEYRTALAQVFEASGMGTSETPVVRLFDSEGEIAHVEELQQRVIDLRAEIAQVGASGGDTTALTQALTATTDELNECKLRATETAQALGSDLGGRASEAQQQLYELNKAIEEQNDVIDDLQKKVDDAKDAFDTLSKSESASADEVERASASYQALADALAQAQERMAMLQGQQADAQVQWDGVNREIEIHDSIIMKLCGGYDNFRSAVSLLPAPLQSATMGVMSLTKSSLAFIATPIGAVIAALVLGLQALYKWFNSSAEGQRAFAKVTGFVNGVLGQLTEIVLKVGKYIYEAFTNPKKVIQDFGNLLESQVMNRVNAVGGMFRSLGKIMKSVFSGQFDEAGKAVKELGNQYMQAVTGVENFGDKASKAMKKVTNAVKDTMDVESAELALREKRSKQAERDSEYEVEIRRLRTESRTAKTEEERLEATQKAMELINKRYDEQAALAQEAYEIQEKRNSITTNSIEDEEKLRSLAVERNRIEAEREQAQMRFRMQESRLQNRQAGTGGSTATTRNTAQEEQARLQAQEEANKKMLALQAQNQQAEIDLMDEGTEKKLAQIEYSYQQQIERIEELAEEMAEANAKAGIAGTNNNGLTDEQQAQVDRQLELLTQTYDKERKQVTDAQIKAEEQAWNEYLIKYGDYLEQRQALIKKYETAISEAQTRGEAETLQKELESALYSLDNSAERTTSIISRLFEDMSRKTVNELRDIIDTAELVMQYLGAEKDEQGNANINGVTVGEQDILDLGMTPETLKRLQESPDDMEALRKAIENVRKELGNKSPFQKMAQDIKNATQQLKDGELGAGIQNIAEALNDYLQSVAELGQELASAFGSEKLANSISNVGQAMNGLSAVGGGIGQAMSGDIVGGIQGALGGVATMVSSIGSLMSRDSDKNLERDIEALTLINQSLEYAISELTDKISDNTTSLADAQTAYEQSLENIAQMEANTQEMMARSGSAYKSGIGGSHSSNYRIDTSLSSADWQRVSEVAGVSVQNATDFWNLTSEQMYNVAVQASDLYALIKDKADNGYKDAAQYMDDYIEYWKEAEDVANAYFEKLTNTSFDSLADSFKSAVSDMAKTASDFADDFEEMMKNAVIDSLMTSTYNARLQQWYKDFADAMESDGTLTSQEQQDLKDSYMRIVQDARNEIEGLYDTLGWSRTSYSQQGTSGGWTTMSEDTGQELNGRFTALQETGLELLTATKDGNDTLVNIYDINVQIQNTITDSYLELQEINDNTASTVAQLVTIAKYIKSVKENTDKL